MAFVYIVLFLLLIIDAKPKFRFNQLNNDYLSKDNNNIIKGIFVVFVFLRHVKEYLDFSNANIFDNSFLKIDAYLGQLIVALFFFYSGYGILEQIKAKGNKYVSKFFVHRFLPTYLSFVICILIYYVFNLFNHISYSPKTTILAFTGWKSIGNSNWFMFNTFVFYFAITAIFNLIKDNLKLSVIIFTVFSCLFIVFLRVFAHGSWWYDTGLCFASGLWWSLYKDRIEDKLSKNAAWLITTTASIILFILFLLLANQKDHALFIVDSVLLCTSVVLINMRMILSKGHIYTFLSKHIFSVYILQRIVFMVVKNFIPNNQLYLFGTVSFIFVLIISVIYDYLFGKLSKKLFSK